MNFIRKIILLTLAGILLIVLSHQGFLMVRYRFYNGHLELIPEVAAPLEGRTFAPLSAQTAEGMSLAAETDTLRLFVDTTTGDVALYDRRTGVFTRAVPAEEDPSATTLNNNLLRSQLSINYYTVNRVPARMNSFADSVYHGGQVTVESIPSGVRVIYELGDASIRIVPFYITPERLDYFFDQIIGTSEHTRNRPRYEESDIPGHLQLAASARRSDRILTELEEVFASLGYTEEDFFYDYENSGVISGDMLRFIVPVDFVLDDDTLEVSVNTTGISEFGGGRIGSIQLMRNFGAGHSSEDGYIVVPNGSGSLIRFNNGRTYVGEYEQFIYDLDLLFDDHASFGNTETARLPFFGVSGESFSFLGRISSGDAIASLTAGVSGRIHEFNYIYPSFTLRGSMSLQMFGVDGAEAALPVVERDLPDAVVAVRYTPLIAPYAGYSGMARLAREQLIEEGILTPLEPKDDIPFYMDLIGSVAGQKFFAGISYMGQIPMTTFEQAHVISEAMRDIGIERQIINYAGWFNRGFYHDVAERIRPVGALGRVSYLEQLARNVENTGGKLYSEVALNTVTFASRNYRWQLESSRYYGGGSVAWFGVPNPITLFDFGMGYMEVFHNPVSPRFLTRYVERYISAFSRFNLTGTSLRDLGSFLASDRRRNHVIGREAAKHITVHNFELLEAEGQPLMVSGGNLYSLRFASDIINAPISHNAFNIVDEEIPFFAMIVHGSIEFAGSPINLGSVRDEREIILRLLEHNAAPRFTFTYQSATEMKYTGKNMNFATNFRNWTERASEIYHEVNEILAPLSNIPIQEHEILQDGVRRITYQNGTQLILNFSDREVSLDGFAIPPLGYFVREGTA